MRSGVLVLVRQSIRTTKVSPVRLGNFSDYIQGQFGQQKWVHHAASKLEDDRLYLNGRMWTQKNGKS